VDGFCGTRRCERSGPLRYRTTIARRPRREMGQRARINAKRKFCANDVIPQYERYYQRVLESASAAKA